jgi:hypothetical protein
MKIDRKTGHNKVLALGGLMCFLSATLLGSKLLLRINNIANKPAHRQYPKRWPKFVVAILPYSH